MNSLVVLLGIQVLVSILLITWVRLRVLRSLDDGDSIARVRREIGALIIELDGSADRNITLIEDRLRELKDCIAEADKRIVMLSNERARTWAPTPTPIQLSSQEPLPASRDQLQRPLATAPISPAAVPASQAAAPAAPPAALGLQVDSQPVQSGAGVQAASAVPTYGKERHTAQDTIPYGTVQSTAVPFIRFSDKPLVFEEPFNERVLRLYKRGFSSDIIAAKLKATIAEVDLAIAAGSKLPEGRGEG